MSLKVIDIIYIVIILVLAFTGFHKGFFSQLFTIVGVVLGLVIAYFFSDNLAPYVGKVTGENPWNNLISFIILFVLFFLLCKLLNKAFKESLEAVGAQGADKIFGFTFGAVQGLVVVTGITMLLTAQPFFDSTGIFEGSKLGNFIVSILPEIEKIFPTAQEVLEEFDLVIPEESGGV